ncbi:MAG: hypothetical protein K9J74_00495 [Sulfuritalea sp.]|nr:hypothetical protein [Sulfuritalea sp.]
MKNFFVWKAFALYNHWCRRRLFQALPGIEDEIADYLRRSKTTGTKFPTLWRAVRIILKERPVLILECGTGLSTIVLAAAVKYLRASNTGYEGKIISMESVEHWFETARKNLPDKYSDVVELVLGPREKYEFLFFRGYRHSNISPLDYDFVFLDGPSYDDDNGGSFCADVFHVAETSSAPVIRGVIDTRVSSVFVLQKVFGGRAVRYYPFIRTSDFSVKRRPFRVKISSRDFRSNMWGEVDLCLELPPVQTTSN